MNARRIALPPDEATLHRGIPVTTPARTLLDLAETLNRHQLEAAITEAEIGRTVTRSDLEVAFLAFLDAHGLPRPRTNHRIELTSGAEPCVVSCPAPSFRVAKDHQGITCIE